MSGWLFVCILIVVGKSHAPSGPGQLYFELRLQISWLHYLTLTTLKYICINHVNQKVLLIWNHHKKALSASFKYLDVMGLQPLSDYKYLIVLVSISSFQIVFKRRNLKTLPTLQGSIIYNWGRRELSHCNSHLYTLGVRWVTTSK